MALSCTLSKATSGFVPLVMVLLLVCTPMPTGDGTTQVTAKSMTKHPQRTHYTDLHSRRSTNLEPLTGGSGVGEQFVERCDARACVRIEQRAVNHPNSMFNVQIINYCITCTICHVHAYCPEFESTISVNPNVFIRISNSVCRINGGHAIHPGQMLLFSYGASFQTVIRPHSCVRCRW